MIKMIQSWHTKIAIEVNLLNYNQFKFALRKIR